MEILSLISSNIGTYETGKWIAVSIIASAIFACISIFLFTSLFKIKESKTKLLKIILIQMTIRFFAILLVPVPYHRLFNMFCSVILFKIAFKQNIEKCILGVVINSLTVICTEVVFSKFFCLFFEEINNYTDGMKDYRYKFCVIMSIAVCRALICYFVKKKNITINISDNLNNKNRNTIILIAIMSAALIFFNSIEMTMYISNFPYGIFILDIISLVIVFYISMTDIIEISILEEKEATINNLEAYNKTLSIMYDNIRAFRHDFSNYIQALDGFVRDNNIEGIKKMNDEVLKECRDVNNMGILNPKTINNPAIYSIITNKYYLAQEQDITMSIEVMLDLNEINISNYNFCRILAILLDNAIEAAKECEEKVVNVTFRQDARANRKLVIIENTYNKVDIDIDKIFEKGYSTKKEAKESHGLGLWTVRKILNNSKNLNLFTKKDAMFSQQLEIYG